MITENARTFLEEAAELPIRPGPRTARAFMLVSPTQFSLSTETASDNRYMDLGARVDPERAAHQHATLAEAIRRHARKPVKVFEAAADTPDSVFPNNVFATVPGKAIIGAMKHSARQKESRRQDILAWFRDELGYGIARLDQDPATVTELTGPLIIDHARWIGFHGKTERLNDAGIAACHDAFGFAASFVFELARGEYHTNVVMSVLAGRALVIHEGSFADRDAARAIERIYGEHVVLLDDEEKAAFCGNCIALTENSVWMSERAENALSSPNRAKLAKAGFVVHAVDISEIEKAGGSLRCCVAEIF